MRNTQKTPFILPVLCIGVMLPLVCAACSSTTNDDDGDDENNWPDFSDLNSICVGYITFTQPPIFSEWSIFIKTYDLDEKRMIEVAVSSSHPRRFINGKAYLASFKFYKIPFDPNGIYDLSYEYVYGPPDVYYRSGGRLDGRESSVISIPRVQFTHGRATMDITQCRPYGLPYGKICAIYFIRMSPDDGSYIYYMPPDGEWIINVLEFVDGSPRVIATGNQDSVDEYYAYLEGSPDIFYAYGTYSVEYVPKDHIAKRIDGVRFFLGKAGIDISTMY